jgi:hypothetical protein
VDVATPIGRHGVPLRVLTSAEAAGFHSDVDPLNTH